MPKRSVLEMILGGVFGALLGGVITALLLFSEIQHWLIYLPIGLGSVAGLWKGDRALLRLLKLIELWPG